eukprot:SM000068S20563  [mRNA]  locus=s68:99274:101261:- [translate_table: standard]
MGGNKLRKLDAVVPALLARGVTDVVTCGGCQSAHAAAVAVACAQSGMRAHLLLRGEPPQVPTGYNLVSGMCAATMSYVPRSEYADREHMLQKHASRIEREGASAESSVKVGVIKEGAGDALALLGLVRLVHSLASGGFPEPTSQWHLVVDSGTGTTAVGLALGIWLLKLPWQVVGVTLAGSEADYAAQQRRLIAEAATAWLQPSSGSAASTEHGSKDNGSLVENLLKGSEAESADCLPLVWVERLTPRRFGKVLPGEIRRCRAVAQSTGILLNPIYTLAGWEWSEKLALTLQGTVSSIGQAEPSNESTLSAGAGQLSRHGGGVKQGCTGVKPDRLDHINSKSRGRGRVAMVHTGGLLGLFGLAQRSSSEFHPP